MYYYSFRYFLLHLIDFFFFSEWWYPASQKWQSWGVQMTVEVVFLGARGNGSDRWRVASKMITVGSWWRQELQLLGARRKLISFSPLSRFVYPVYWYVCFHQLTNILFLFSLFRSWCAAFGSDWYSLLLWNTCEVQLQLQWNTLQGNHQNFLEFWRGILLNLN